MTQTAHMDPHAKVQFAKMTMQTKCIRISMRLRIKDDNVLKNLNDQRNKIIKLRKRFTEENSLNILTTDLERCKARKRHDT